MVGLAVMLAGGAPLARWGVHLAAALLGWFAYLIAQRLTGDGGWLRSRWLPLVGVGLVGSTLLAADIDGVNRWHLVGPLRLHCSSGAIVWMRHDPLPPAPFVEDIVAVAFRVTPLVGVLIPQRFTELRT